MAGKRIKINNIDLSYTCENSKYQTNIDKGKKHYKGLNHKGCVAKIFDDGDSSLFLEYVFEFKKPNNEIYWLMWYDSKGKPSIHESVVFDKKDLEKIMRSITTFKL